MFDFFKTTMPKTREADYYLGALNSCVFIDFNKTRDGRISLIRISFDGYGCCNLDDRGLSLNHSDSRKFMEEIENEQLNQEAISWLVKEIVRINKHLLWVDALKRYNLI